jgi:transglutaminase-like putative cysteine protease
MNRREFLWAAGVASASLALPKAMGGRGLVDPVGAGWRTFEVTTTVEILEATGPTLVWLPAALIRDTPYQKTVSNEFRVEGGTAELVAASKPDALGIIAAKFPAGTKPVVRLTSRVSTKNVAVDVSSRGGAPKADQSELQNFLRPTKLMPTDGIVKTTAEQITRGARTDLEKARAIYEWIVDNTFRKPTVRGCGVGDVRFMLESKDLGGKCADLNALYVALARSVGLPARDVYGLRVAKSDLGYTSLGVATENVTRAQHCRAEVYLNAHGWVPVDPADVRKVVLEEPPGHRPLTDEMVTRARTRLFGSWEMNWIALNFGHDVVLPGSSGPPINFFMYPQAESAGARLDPLDPDHFKYQILAKPISA